ncbi:transmembrane prolyl 4-hydroxylase isoform X2 [Nematostella vectensis]|uniref:transmembrane prolyl 4-hydroxylase isoform X2 n=1 Tax=Nematostella vectensis TaxID=45351 RepID=UPI00139048B1|nr:transmembrane prolyl 4-hydroxylase isoform X2 [Nematostella vectensis]
MKYFFFGTILTIYMANRLKTLFEPDGEGTLISDLSSTSTRTLFYYDNISRIPVVKLAKLNGVRVGHKKLLNLEEGQTHHMITRSLRPLMFEVPHFLSDAECDHIIEIASEQEFEESMTTNSCASKEAGKEIQADEDCNNLIRDFDSDSDGQISPYEFNLYIEEYSSVYRYYLEDIKRMWEVGNVDTNHDGFLDLNECINADTSALEELLTDYEKNPTYRARYSDHTWLPVDNVIDSTLKRIQQRLSKLIQMPIEILEKSEEMQVVKYEESGHFHAHYDSKRGTPVNETTLPCCPLTKFLNGDSELIRPDGKCHLCRFMSVVYYLNDVTAGGETAFPVADNETFDDEELKRQGIVNLSKYCNKSNVIMKPAKGTAIFFYNHHIDQETGQIGPVDKYSLHGGCDVKEGSKWIATTWVNIPHFIRRKIQGHGLP